VRFVDREARVLTRPAKGAAVLAVVPEGVQVVVLGSWGRWAQVTYIDPAAETRRTGWVLKKYLE
jgi:Bacterial SH3 domain